MSLVYSGFSPDCTFTSFTPMYQQAYGIIETLSPLHVGATAGEESGNLNLIFRDPFTQTGIIPGSSLRGRFRAEMRFRED